LRTRVNGQGELSQKGVEQGLGVLILHAEMTVTMEKHRTQ